jgi:DNA-directed RNA polymerase beta subunit
MRIQRNYFGSLISKNEGLQDLSVFGVDDYNSFLSENGGLVDIFKSSFPVSDMSGLYVIDYVSHRISEPQCSHDVALKKKSTYCANLYVTFRLIQFRNEDSGKTIKSIKEQEIQVCQIPLATEHCTFIINGVERVVISQLHRSPGVIFTRDIVDGSGVYNAVIIPSKGSWLEFTFDAKGSMYFKIDKKKKSGIINLLYGIGMDASKILNSFYESIEVKYFDKDLWEIDVDPSKLIGERSKISIYSELGDLVVKQGDIVTRKSLNLIQSKKIYTKNIDLGSFILFDDLLINSDIVAKKLSYIGDKEIELIRSCEKIKVVDIFSKKYSQSLMDSIVQNKDVSYESALQNFFKILKPNDIFTLEDAQSAVKSTFFDQSRYDLLNVGRYKLNQSLGIDIDHSVRTLTEHDIVSTISHLLFMRDNSLPTDDVDHLGNRRVRSVVEMLENVISSGVSRIAKSCSDKMSSITSDSVIPSDFIIQHQLQKPIKDFFTSQLAQFLEQTNPLSEIGHKRRISALGIGGISRDRAGLDVRDIHITHYGRICLVETPEGQNIGLISNLATFAKLNAYGFIQTPYYVVKNGIITQQIIMLDSSQEHDKKIAQFDGIAIQSGSISSDSVFARYMGDFISCPSSEIELMDFSSRQIVSVPTSCIPFVENDDVARALMGANMQRQAVPLLNLEQPLVGTGSEGDIAVSSSSVILSRNDGVVVSCDSETIVVNVENPQSIESIYDFYHLKKFTKTNQGTSINQYPKVSIGQSIKKGDVIVEGYSVKNGELSIGRNIMVAFIPWNGYGFEDSIVVSERLIHENVFTSVHVEEFEIVARDTKLGAEEITRDIPNMNENSLYQLDDSGVIALGMVVKPGDILVGKVTPVSETPLTSEERLLKAIFNEKVSDVKDSSLRVPPSIFGTVIHVDVMTRRGMQKDDRTKQIELKQLNDLKKKYQFAHSAIERFFTDKIISIVTGKNISKSCKLKTKSLTSIDSHFVKSLPMYDRFRILLDDENCNAQILKLKLDYEKAKSVTETKYNNDIKIIIDGVDDLPHGVLKTIRVYVATKRRLQPGDKMSGRHGNKGVVSKIGMIEDMPFMSDGTPIDIILNPVGIPGRMNLGQILEVHLGMAAKGIGRKIQNRLSDYKNASEVKQTLLEVLSDKNLKLDIEKMSDDQIIEFANVHKDGLLCATPVFDGCKVSDIETMLEKAGYDKSGQFELFDGKTGEKFDRKVTVGYMYMLKLHHLVDSKIHARSIGPYSLITQQPSGGKSRFGGQRIGEMEAWALEAYGAAYTLQEMFTIKSDDVEGRSRAYRAIVANSADYTSGMPESVNVMIKELRSLALNVNFESDI